jgi:hypothetical protein
MAGSKQHYIPQSLLRGFAVQRARKTKIEQVWVLPTTGEPFCPAIDGIAAQHYFYSELSTAGERTLDDAITDYEGRFTSILTDIRTWPGGIDVDSELCGEFISHLVLRNILLTSDLRNWWNEQEEWSGFERLQSLVYHVDRPSWGMGIFTWRRPDGEWTVFAPTAPAKG